MRVVVTGGCGFIGSHVVDLLHSQGHEALVLDNLITGKTSVFPNGVKWHVLDVCNETETINEITGFKPDAVFHLAAQAAISTSLEDPRYDALVNIEGTINVLRGAKLANVRRFVFASTSAVYMDGVKTAIKETRTALKPSSPYGISKLAAEQYVRWVFPNNHVILRLGNVYGPRQVPIGENQLIARMIRHFRDKHSFFIHGDGKQERDFVYVEDVAKAFRAGLSGKPGTYNISYGEPVSVNAAAETMAALWGFHNYEWKHDDLQDERRRVWLDIFMADRELGWSPETDLQMGIGKTIEWWNALTPAPFGRGE